jgi:hypothetical protein
MHVNWEVNLFIREGQSRSASFNVFAPNFVNIVEAPSNENIARCLLSSALEEQSES